MRQSIFLKITLLFLITFIGMGIGFFAVHEELLKEHRHQLEMEAGNLFLHLRKSVPLSYPMRRIYLQKRGYSIISPSANLLKTLKNTFDTIPENFPEEIKESMQEGRIQVLKDERNLYIYLTKATPPMLIVKSGAAAKPVWPEIVFLVLMISLLVLYWLIIKTLFPLKTLIHAIVHYGKEGNYTPINSPKKDEIALVANALDGAMRKNQTLMEARRLFLRNIMHELKTPITVGKLALPFLHSGEEKSILERAFFRMEHLIGELVRVEQITSGALAPNIQPCQPKALIDKAKELLFLSDETVVTLYDDSVFYADCDVFITVFKNLIDNAIKYSPDHMVRITQQGSSIVFCNRGEPWPAGTSLKALSEPFFHSNENSYSFGLGLYIVQSIIDAHNFKLTHHYSANEHYFTLECRNPLVPLD
ncbi:MAG: ArsS family sensor histidine kinase [Sulfuricurvum sp.]|uniref:ArsS family sensor histidine kinase n=1 Tax=Sulfuricurvum sp. TaxID=2025608 RepID=UPI00356A9A6B